jgi:hypothetical protein
MKVLPVLDAAGRRRSPATLPGYHIGRPPRTRGSAIRLIRRPSMRSWRPCATHPTIVTAGVCER